MPSRRRPLALLVLVAVTALIAGCGSSDNDKGSGGSSSSGGKADATALLKKAFSTKIGSGKLQADISAQVEGSGPLASGPLKATIEGPFKTRGKKEVPLLDLTLNASVAGQNIDARLVTTEDNAFIGFRGQTYEIGKQLFKQFVDKAKQGQGSSVTNVGDLGLKPDTWLDDPKVTSGPSIGGDSTQKVSGEIDADAMIRDLVGTLKSGPVRDQLKRQGRPVPTVSDDQIKKVVDALKDPSFEVDVDGKGRLRRAAFKTGFEIPDSSGDTAKSGKVSFSVELPEVGTNPDIKAPSGAKPIQLLLQQFGLGAGAGGLGGLKTN